MTNFNRRAGTKRSNGRFAFMRGHHLVIGLRHRPMQGTARRRYLRQSLDRERRMGWLPTFRVDGRWIWPKT